MPSPKLMIALSIFSKELFKLFILIYMNIVKKQTQVQALSLTILVLIEPHKQFLKSWFLDLYFEKSHFDFYWFCQQYKDCFDINGVNRDNYTIFATGFLTIILFLQPVFFEFASAFAEYHINAAI